MTGKMLAHYELGDRLGEGGSGVVYQGRDLRLDRTVAIKVLADALRDDELAWARLLREARLASQLNHPHIAAIYDLGEDDGRAYIVMEYVEGLALADLIPEGGMPAEQVRRYAVQIADALAYAHEHGTLHGDLKGSNIVVTPEGNVKLLDFGLGRRIPRHGMTEVTSSSQALAEAGTTAGTLPYIAPEVLRGGATSVQSDAWALGVLIYQMATGELPFRGETAFDLSLEIMTATPHKLGLLPEPLQSAVQRCLEKDPAARVPHVAELAAVLKDDATRVEPKPSDVREAASSPQSQPAETTVTRHRRRWWMAGAAMALLTLLLGGVYGRHLWALRHSVHALAVNAAQPTNAEDPNAKVWVNTDSGTYHCPGTRWYGQTHTGEYMTQKDARAKGYHPAGKHACH